MKKSLINKFISQERFNSYTNLDEYNQNLILSKNAYIPLSILEVTLKNSINEHLSVKVGQNWYENQEFLTQDSLKKVNDAKNILFKRGEKITKSKIVAELSFGFWVNLFKKPYAKKLRTYDLKKIFLNLPSKKDKIISREILYKELNHIRNFRNRVFHYEKILNKDNFENIFDEIYELLEFFDNELSQYARDLNNE
ncbi:hypothetical protein CRU96_08310 [Malaciobacter halophilus]|nr:Abi family protein [Malaciobacter halophilus]RYA23358.1 hypothetical protein CRU96_08310 [Malaciobacter halophilus]